MQIVLADESFMAELHSTEAQYVATSSDYKDEWEEYVKRLKHREGCCPHGDEEEREAYQRVVASMTNCADKRLEWASEYVTDWIRNSVSHFFSDEEGIFYFVKDHPVDSVWHKYHAKWLNLDDVHGYCPSCDEPLCVDDLLKVTKGSHVFDKDCRMAGCGDGASLCLFNAQGDSRDVYECNSCNWADATQDIEGDESFISKHGRPFNWPPGAPYPPRRSFSGFPMDVPPYED
jgi:hypothetical protein